MTKHSKLFFKFVDWETKMLSHLVLFFRLAPCYETATTRAFYNGRTETLRPCTVELSKWINAMLEKEVKVCKDYDLHM